MNRRFALVALWAVFAAASVGVGFGAAGLVGTPFTDVGSASRGNQAGAANAASIPSDSSSSVATSPAEDSSAPSKSAKTAKSATSAKANKSASARRSAAVRAATAAGTKRAASKSASPRSRATRSSGGGGGSSGTKAAASATVTHGSVSTRGGYVSGTCRSGLIALSASPAVGWRLDGVSGGYSASGEAEFEQSADGDSKVKVDAWCAAGKPAFSVENRDGGGGGGGGGGGDGSGSGGGGGSDD